jgi:hypothetical protein
LRSSVDLRKKERRSVERKNGRKKLSLAGVKYSQKSGPAGFSLISPESSPACEFDCSVIQTKYTECVTPNMAVERWKFCAVRV